MDEAIYVDIAHNLIKGQGLNTELFSVFIPYLEKYSFWYPPGYFIFLGIILKLFGVGILQARFSSLILGGSVLWLIAPLTNNWLRSKYALLIATILLISDFYFQDGSIVARMEIITIFWSVLAAIFHQRYLLNRRQLNNFISGIFGALAIITHPTAIVFLLPISLNLLFLKQQSWQKWLKSCLVFASPILAVLVGWIMSFWPQREIFYIQNAVQVHRKEFSPFFIIETFRYKPIHRLILATYYLSNLLFIIQQLRTKDYRHPQNKLWLFLAFTAIFVPFLLKEMWYVIYTSFMGALILTRNIELAVHKFQRRLVYFLPIIILMANSIIFFNRINEIQHSLSYNQFSAKIADKLPVNTTLLTASYPDPIFYLQQHRPDIIFKVTPNNSDLEPIDFEVYNEFLGNVDYVVLSFFLNHHIYQYIKANMEEIIYQSNQDIAGQTVWLIKLKPRDQRTALPVDPDLYWPYPTLSPN